MKKFGLLVVAALGFFSTAVAQDVYYSIFSFTHTIPEVDINDRSASLQASLYPELYKTRSVRRDMQWVAQNDSHIISFWSEKGDTILHILTELSGIEWHESAFDIYLVRYYPSLGSGDPVIIPLGGMKTNSLIEAAPADNRLILNLVFQLAKRMLAQTVQPQDSVYLRLADHPLMRPGPYRRDNLAMLLAMATCNNIIGLDSTNDAYNSAFWVAHFPGHRILDEHFLSKWFLTPYHTLAEWIAQEPHWSHLVALTSPPRVRQKPAKQKQRSLIEGLPIKGQLGFSVKFDEANYLVVDTIDVYRLAYACGLRAGDRIRTVDGYRVKNHRELVARIIDKLNQGGATLQILRNDRIESIVIRPMILPDLEDSLYFEDGYFLRDDTLPAQWDSVSNEVPRK
ncbi:MAG: PDZ domain-containing protein [Candidatus Zixiibacteriota bacterium]